MSKQDNGRTLFKGSRLRTSRGRTHDHHPQLDVHIATQKSSSFAR
jgi:hypothetical protein